MRATSMRAPSMLRTITVAIVLTIAAALPAVAQQVGGGVTIFIPEATWLSQGTVSYEAQFGTSIGLGGLFSVPVGIAYDKVDGLLPNGTGISQRSLPWAVTDSFMLSAGLKLTIPVSIMFLEAEGGGVLQWNAGVLPLDGNIAATLAPAGTIWAWKSVDASAPFGYGYYAGGAIGVNIKGVRLTLKGGYRYTLSPLTLSGSYYQTDTGNVTTSGPTTLNKTDASLRLAGVYVGITGSVGF